MNRSHLLLCAALAIGSAGAGAQQAAPKAASPAPQPEVWKYQTHRLDRAEIDKLLAEPSKVLVIDVRRPDEVVSKGSFPVYLSVQAKDLENELAFLPHDRKIITLSNHAHRAGAAGDLLTSKGFLVAGAAGSEDYEAQGGKITRIVAPAPTASR